MADRAADSRNARDAREVKRAFLLDTHAFLWLAGGDDRITQRVVEIAENPRVDFFLSVASVWEIAVKKSLGRLELVVTLDQFVRRQLDALRTQLLDVRFEHVLAVEALPFHHRDPFDRLLVAQAMTENLNLLSADSQLDRYGVVRVW